MEKKVPSLISVRNINAHLASPRVRDVVHGLRELLSSLNDGTLTKLTEVDQVELFIRISKLVTSRCDHDVFPFIVGNAFLVGSHLYAHHGAIIDRLFPEDVMNFINSAAAVISLPLQDWAKVSCCQITSFQQ